MKIGWQTALFSLIVVSILATSVLAYSFTSSTNSGATPSDAPMCKTQCANHIPAGTCTPGTSKCVTLTGPDCVFLCKVDGTWDDGAYCPNSCWNDQACNPYPPAQAHENYANIDTAPLGHFSASASTNRCRVIA